MPFNNKRSPAAVRSLYYPSLVVNLQIRFEEGTTEVISPDTVKSLLERVFAEKRSVQVSEPGQVKIVRRSSDVQVSGPGPVTIVGRSSDKEKGIQVSGPGQVIVVHREAGSSNDKLTQVIGLVPTQATVEIPAYRQAGTFNLTFLHRDFPLDPRVLRACGVAVHLGSVPAGDWGAGMMGRTSLGRRRSVIQTSDDNLLIAGTVDSVNASHTENSSIVRMEGRDLRGIMLDTLVMPVILKTVDLKKPLNVVIEQLVQELSPFGGGIPVEVDPNEWPEGVPAVFVAGDRTRPNLSADGNKAKAGGQGESTTMSYWDLITQWCFLCGAIPYFVGSKLRIRPAVNLYDARRKERAFDPRFPYPFKGNKPRDLDPPQVKASETFGYRRMVYGRDLLEFNLERKIGGVVMPAVTCVSVDTDGKKKGADQRIIEVTYPSEEEQKTQAASKVAPSGKRAQTDPLIIPVRGIRNKKRLLAIAKALHAEICRQEIGGSASTRNLASFGGDASDPDLLTLRPGDAVEFRVDASGLSRFPPPINELNNSSAQSFAEEVRAVAKRMGSEDLAKILVASNRGLITDLTRTFRVSTVKFDWDTERGVGISFDFQNFVEVRNTPPEEQTADVQVKLGQVKITATAKTAELIGEVTIIDENAARIGEVTVGEDRPKYAVTAGLPTIGGA